MPFKKSAIGSATIASLLLTYATPLLVSQSETKVPKLSLDDARRLKTI